MKKKHWADRAYPFDNPPPVGSQIRIRNRNGAFIILEHAFSDRPIPLFGPDEVWVIRAGQQQGSARIAVADILSYNRLPHRQ